MAQKLLQQQQLKEVGSKLEKPPASKDALIKLLKQAANYLSELGQSPLPSMLEAMQPIINAIVKPELLKHHDRDIEVLVATCICEITRITAPEAPYSDEVLRDIFHLFVGIFSGLNDINSPSFGRRVVILETLSRYKSCIMMLDLECADLINKMFQTFLAVISEDHPEGILMSMQTIMILILDESEDIPENLLFTLLFSLGRKRSDVPGAARKLSMNVIGNCVGKLETPIKQFLSSSISGDIIAPSNLVDYHEVIFDIYQCAPQILFGVIPYITGELLTGQLDIRLKAVELLGDMFALPGILISESFQPLFAEFLKRLTDRAVEVRVSVIEHVKNCLMSDSSRREAPEIISALTDRLLDYDENVRKEVVAAIFSVAYNSISCVPSVTVRLVAERLRDKSVSVKQYTMERLAELYKLYCTRSSDDSINDDNFEWIPGKILRCIYDKDFRLEAIEDTLCHRLFPPEISVEDKLEHWVAIFSCLEKVEVKALEQILLQKQRLQQEMQKYLSLRQIHKDGDNPDLQKRILSCFRTAARLFHDPVKAEESFQILNQLKDAKIFKILTCLLDPCTSFSQASTSRDDLLTILGEKHPLYDFMDTLSLRCSYLLFNKELVKEIFLKAGMQQCDGNKKLLPCMNLLAVLSYFSPSLLYGFEEDLVSLLKEDNEIIKEGIAHVLAKAGGIIREQLATSSSSVDLLLERLCLEGSRIQAKYSVQALAAITKDDGLRALSVLYKRLVDMMEEKTHLPAILQSLGCIAQNAMPVFETKEREIVDFITKKILESSDGAHAKHKSNWNSTSQLCLLKIYGIKMMVKSYMPLKDTHLRHGIEKLLEILKNILLFGEISENIESSPVDKAHLRLAAAKAILRLSKQWDHKIPLDIFYLTLGTSQNPYPEVRKLFTSKVCQYIKERLLDAKYACAFLYNIAESHPPEIKEDTHYLVEVVQMQYQLKARQLSIQCDLNPHVAYPEYILTYLLHVLAHHPSFPDVEDGENVQAFEPMYWRLQLFLSILFYGNEGSNQATDRTKNSFSTVISIFYSIKCSEDIVNEVKTKNLQALCDLGILIAKNLVKEHGDLKELIVPVPLPPLLYQSIVRENDGVSLVIDEKSWLEPKAVAYFLSLGQEKKTDDSAYNDENISKDSEGDGNGINELPLGIIMRNLKSEISKKKKMVRKQACPSGVRKSDIEVDVLGMVREINLGKAEQEQSMEIDKIYHENKPCTDANITNGSITGASASSVEKNRKLNMSMSSLSTPKRKRSSFSPKSNSKIQPKSGGSLSSRSAGAGDLSHVRLEHSSDEENAKSTDSDTTRPFGSMKKGRSKTSNGRSYVEESYSDPKLTGLKKAGKENSNSKFLAAQVGKRKLKSAMGLSKCSQKTLKESELVGCRIKVWWPMDKEFYEGKVQSYDPGKKKHTILYDDGDVEVLLLDKEKWELISNDNTPTKRQKSHHYMPEEELSKKKRDQTTDDESTKKKRSGNKTSSSRLNRKVPGNNKNGPRRFSEKTRYADSSDTSGEGKSDPSDSEIHATSEIDDAQSDGPGERSRSCSQGEGKSENVLEVVENPLEGEEREHSCSSEPAEDEEKTEQDHMEIQADVRHDPSASSREADNSDDEPLNAWRQRAGK